MNTNYSRVAVVTGGSRGIGAQVAQRLAAAGYAVAVAYQHGKDAADAVVDGIGGDQALAVRADVADENDVTELFAAAERTFGGIDVVVHAAGSLTTKPLVELELDEIDQMLRTNLRGTLVVNRQAAKSVRAGGAIVNVSSALTRLCTPGYTAYGATKSGVEAITKILAKELAGRDITVNAVAPGATETDMLRTDMASTGDAEQTRRNIIGITPLGRIGTPDDIATVILSLVGETRWIHGQTLHVSGGIAI
ncbi:SDR family oxidoreductase [Lentzea sp. NPDC059081]|uniref:SDR family oxidoreductase n=1 Tax=Lentzea sp. NPDC059081 TaxID=3346719 RepID=UPI0036944971